MTRSVTIVNSSNWDGEPLLIDGVVLEAGDMLTLAVGKQQHGLTILVTPVGSIKPTRPFGTTKDSGPDHIKQVMPEVQVVWKVGAGMIRKGNDDYTDATDKVNWE